MIKFINILYNTPVHAIMLITILSVTSEVRALTKMLLCVSQKDLFTKFILFAIFFKQNGVQAGKIRHCYVILTDISL